MSSLPESLRSTATAEGIEKFLAGAKVHRCSAVLVVTRSPNDEFLPGIEEVPSGGVETDQSLAAALDRELLEEVGFEAETIDDGFIEYFDYISASGRHTRHFTVAIPLGERSVRLSEEHVNARWITAEELGDARCTPETLGVLEALDPFDERARRSRA